MERKVQPSASEDIFCAARWKHLIVSCLHAGIQNHTLEPFCWKWKWKWPGIRPSIVTHTLNLCSAINPSKSLHTAVNTHTQTVNTHLEQWAAINAAAPGEELCVRCLAQGHLSRGIEGGESCTFTPPTDKLLPDLRLELATFWLRVQLSNH